jgi:hypothetical protein
MWERTVASRYHYLCWKLWKTNPGDKKKIYIYHIVVNHMFLLYFTAKIVNGESNLLKRDSLKGHPHPIFTLGQTRGPWSHAQTFGGAVSLSDTWPLQLTLLILKYTHNFYKLSLHCQCPLKLLIVSIFLPKLPKMPMSPQMTKILFIKLLIFFFKKKKLKKKNDSLGRTLTIELGVLFSKLTAFSITWAIITSFVSGIFNWFFCFREFSSKIWLDRCQDWIFLSVFLFWIMLPYTCSYSLLLLFKKKKNKSRRGGGGP